MNRFVFLSDVRVRRTCAWLVAAACVFSTRSGYAVELVFQLQGPNSLVADPYVNALQMHMTGQDPGNTSLTTTYSGTVTVDVDDVMNPTSIAFVSADIATANSGDWLPQVGGGDAGEPEVFGDANPGTAAPANYGFFVEIEGAITFYGATRETTWSITADPRAVTGGQFDPASINLPITHGFFDGNISSEVYTEAEGASREDIAFDSEPGDPEEDYIGINCMDHLNPGNSCGSSMGSYSVEGDTATLTLPLNFHIGGGTPVVQFAGTWTGTASLVEEELVGDYNEDGTVNAADYAVWRDNVGATDALANDDLGGVIGSAHYDQWRAAFGNPGSGSGTAAVPEPASVMLVLVGLVGMWLGRRGLA